MSTFLPELTARSGNSCELCASTENLTAYDVPPTAANVTADRCALLCDTCLKQVTKENELDTNHWHCLNEAAWSEVPAIQALSYRLLTRLSSEGWANDLLEQIYLEDEIQEWAEAEALIEGIANSAQKTLDSNGVELLEGDDVYIIKDLEVKGARFTAKRGTIVKNIHLTNNPEHIEGRVNKTKLVLKTCFMKKA